MNQIMETSNSLVNPTFVDGLCVRIFGFQLLRASFPGNYGN